MITLDDYKSLLDYKTGMPLAQVRRNDAADIINDSFTNDAEYRPVRILTQDGWKVVDAKFIQHQTQSISGDIVDFWLQFRPYEHYTIGSYVIIPADGELQPNTYEQEYAYFADENVSTKNESNLWMIANQNNRDASLRYNILRCNWKFKWVDDNHKLCDCIGAIRMASSYTSGVWTDQYSTALDNLTSAILPDTHAVYSDKFTEFGLADTRDIDYDMRFMLTHNKKRPHIYRITKVLDLAPQGLIKLSVKQDEFNVKRDDLGLMVCDYYDDSGNTRPDEPTTPSDKSQTIYEYTLNDDYELVDPTEVTDTTIYFGIVKYFGIVDDSDAVYHWKVKLDADSHDDVHDDEYYENLIQIQDVDSRTISLQVSKASSVIGKKFTLSVYDKDNTSYSSLSLTVQEV